MRLILIILKLLRQKKIDELGCFLLPQLNILLKGYSRHTVFKLF